MEVTKLPANRREHLGTKHTRRLRQKGLIPAIIYGHGEAPLHVSMDAHEIKNTLHHHARVLDVDLDGQHNQYLIKAVQYDYLGTTPIHLDLMRVNLDERVHVTVEVVLRGTPKGASEGGMLDQLINDIEVECVVTAIPEEIRIAITHLGIGDSLSVKDLDVPDGVTILLDPDDKVAICRAPTVQAEVEETEEAEAGAGEPEVIGRGKEESADKSS